jgi:hypothetical protein
MTTENEFTDQDRVCVNCTHYRRHWDLDAIMDRLFTGSGHYVHRCSYNGVKTQMDPVTGRVTIKIHTEPARVMRDYDSVCGAAGRHWEPSKRFLGEKRNLFKIMNWAGPK